MDLHENERVSENRFQMNGFARRPVLKLGKRQLGNGLFRTKLYHRVCTH